MVSIVICGTEANSIQLCTGVFDGSCLIGCCIAVCLRLLNIIIADTRSGSTVGQHNYTFSGNTADFIVVQKAQRLI